MKTSRWLWLILALHLLLGLAYDWATPILEATDEGSHFAVVHWLADGNPLPVQNPAAPDMTWAQEGSQPPLYYVLAARLAALADMSDFDTVFVRNPYTQVGIALTTHNVNLYRHPLEPAPLAGAALAVKLARWFSLLLSAGAIFFAYRLARALFPAQEALALLTAALAAFNPMALFINASVNNDNLLILLSTAALWIIVRLMRPETPRYRRLALTLGILLGLATLTKLSGMVLWPFAALGVAWGAWRARDLRRFIVSGLLVVGPILAIAGWWFWRNLQLYGDLLGLKTMVAIAGPRLNAPTLAQLISREWQSFWLSYWGVFGGFTLVPAQWVYLFFDALSLIALAGLILAAIRRRLTARWPELTLLALCIVTTLVSVIRWTLQTPASQGRLMFGAIGPLSLFMAAGLLYPWRRGRRPIAAGVTAALVGVAALVPFAYIAPRYRPPARLTEADLPAEMRPLRVTAGDSMELLGYLPDMTPRRPGETASFTLYWRALRPMSRDYSLALHLLGREAAEIGKIDTWPGAGLAPTSFWRAGDILADAYRIPIDTLSPMPALIRLNLAVWESDPDQRIPLRSPDGAVQQSVTFVIGRLDTSTISPLPPHQTEGSRLGAGIRLQGWQWQDDVLTLIWQTDRPLSEDYMVFIHAFDATGAKIAQADGAPLAGDWPTWAWSVGRAFADPHPLPLPANAGRLTLRVGLYDLATGQRLPATRPDGSPWPDNAITLEVQP